MTDSTIRHTLLEDCIAIAVGTFLISIGVHVFTTQHLLTGGTAGLSFLVHYLTGWEFGVVFFLVNLPFYGLAIKKMGWVFTLRTVAAVTLLSLFTLLQSRVLDIRIEYQGYAAVLGGVTMALGFIVLFRHKASLGGINILALYIADKYGVRVGKSLMVTDGMILLCSLNIVSLSSFLVSVAGVAIINALITMNHRPGRYLAAEYGR